jgi:hypothetical protein
MIGRTATNNNRVSQAAKNQAKLEQAGYCSDVSSCMAREAVLESKDQVSRKEICHESDENSFDNEQFNNVSNKKNRVKKSQIKLKKLCTATTDASSSVNHRSKAIKKTNTTVIQVKNCPT